MIQEGCVGSIVYCNIRESHCVLVKDGIAYDINGIYKNFSIDSGDWVPWGKVPYEERQKYYHKG